MSLKPRKRTPFSQFLNKPLYAFLGFAFLEAWAQLLYSSNVLLVTPGELLPLSITHLFSSLAVAACGLLLALFATRITPLSKKRDALYLCGIVGAIATAGVALVSAGILPSWWIVICVMITGATGCWISLVWFELFATQGIRGALVCLAAGMLLGAIIYAIISVLPMTAGIALTIALPLLATFTARPLQSDRIVSYEETRPSLRSLLKKLPLRLIVVVGIIYCSFGVVRTFQLPTQPSFTPLIEWLFSEGSGVLALLIAGIVAFYSYRFSTVFAFYVALPLIAVVSLLLALPVDLPDVLLLSAISSGVSLVRFLVFLLLVEAVASRKVPAVLCFGLLSCLQFAGTLAGQMVAVVFGSSPIVLTTFVLVVLIIAALIALGARNDLTTPAVPINNITANALRLSDQAKLSPRERDVLLIWITGHSSTYVEETLGISKNTVKTHLAHIYAKTNTANREELLRLVEVEDITPKR